MSVFCLKTFLHTGKAGFTLLELLIVTSIVLVVTAGSIASFATFSDKQKALVAAKDVQQLLRSAQTKARVKETPLSCNALIGYKVVINGDNATMRAVCQQATGPAEMGDTSTVRFSGVTKTISANPIPPGYFVFRSLDGGVTSNDALTPLTPIPDTTFTFATAGLTGTSEYSFTLTSQGALSTVSSDEGGTEL